MVHESHPVDKVVEVRHRAGQSLLESAQQQLFERETSMAVSNSVPSINEAIAERPLPKWPLPERILQFGEGNFLRGFADWMVDTLNRQGVFNGSIVVVQPVKQGLVDVLQQQAGLYTLLLRGITGGKLTETR